LPPTASCRLIRWRKRIMRNGGQFHCLVDTYAWSLQASGGKTWTWMSTIGRVVVGCLMMNVFRRQGSFSG
jgi:hypothetical protein